jgi:hypothetical protein
LVSALATTEREAEREAEAEAEAEAEVEQAAVASGFAQSGYNFYVGEFALGCFDGVGVRRFDCGTAYAGKWSGGLLHGVGTAQWALSAPSLGAATTADANHSASSSGRRALLQPPVNALDGSWRRRTAGSKYVGTFDHGLLSGNGRMAWPGGSFYVGGFKGGLEHGPGMLVAQHLGNKAVTLCGTWADGDIVEQMADPVVAPARVTTDVNLLSPVFCQTMTMN